MSSGEIEKRVNKPGKWTNDQIKFMEINHKTMSIEDMAGHLEKNPKTVEKYVKEKLGYTDEAKIAIMAKFDIKKSPLWDEMKQQLSEEEMDTFMYHWQNLMIQFNNDGVLSTERMQMVELVRIEILINRSMRKLKDTDILQKKTTDEILQEKDQPRDQQDVAKITRLEMLISSLYSAHQQLSKEYQELMTRKEQILKTLKATREARIKRIEDMKENIQSFMGSIIDNQEHRRQLGLVMKKQQLALYSELERLGDYHTYEDGTVEQPILNHETLKEDNK